MVTYLGSFVQLCCGGEEHCKQILWCMWGVLAVYGPHWVCPTHSGVCLPGLHCSGSRVLCRALSKVGPVFRVLSRSKPLRSRFLGTLQGHRLGWMCILCLSQSEQLRRAGAWQEHCPRWAVRLNHLPSPGRSVSWVDRESMALGVPCVSVGS